MDRWNYRFQLDENKHFRLRKWRKNSLIFLEVHHLEIVYFSIVQSG